MCRVNQLTSDGDLKEEKEQEEHEMRKETREEHKDPDDIRARKLDNIYDAKTE